MSYELNRYGFAHCSLLIAHCSQLQVGKTWATRTPGAMGPGYVVRTGLHGFLGLLCFGLLGYYHVLDFVVGGLRDDFFADQI